mmetsp:Transcript_13198/g.35528  ORF Transcript_13198/g.35528 Transcript_13198/m.35528 type:complete len:92 (+) Transcript_13198:1521-1796(+)
MMEVERATVEACAAADADVRRVKIVEHGHVTSKIAGAPELDTAQRAVKLFALQVHELDVPLEIVLLAKPEAAILAPKRASAQMRVELRNRF